MGEAFPPVAGAEGGLEGGFEQFHHGGFGQGPLAGGREPEVARALYLGALRDLLLDLIDLPVRGGQVVQALPPLHLEVILDARQVGQHVFGSLHAPDLDLQEVQEAHELDGVRVVRARARRSAAGKQARQTGFRRRPALQPVRAALGLHDQAMGLLLGFVAHLQAGLLGAFVLLDEAPGEQSCKAVGTNGLQAHRLGGSQDLEAVEPGRGWVHGRWGGLRGARGALACHRPGSAVSQEWDGGSNAFFSNAEWAPVPAPISALGTSSRDYPLVLTNCSMKSTRVFTLSTVTAL